LYKTSVTWLLLRCLSIDEGKELLTQTHLGVCRGHIGARVLTAKVFRQGFYWPYIIDDASKLVTTCLACQNFSPNTQAPSQLTQLITPLVATTKMGHRHSRTTDNNTRKPEICSGGSGIFHKMDRGKAYSQHSYRGAQKILLEEHNMPF
jgi:hypothetical protein